jgi:DNA-directed RNA polymerase alpha subunit
MEISINQLSQIIVEAVQSALRNVGILTPEQYVTAVVTLHDAPGKTGIIDNRMENILEMDAAEFFSPERFEPVTRRTYQVRIYNAILNSRSEYYESKGISNVADLLTRSKRELSRLPNFGRKSIDIMDEILFRETGLHLRG